MAERYDHVPCGERGNGVVAQSVERFVRNEEVAGSRPASSTVDGGVYAADLPLHPYHSTVRSVM